ncbi:MAG: HEAT repeat domain-containing protein [Chlamydiales bacterium]|nr:HEAT repeat domain-containing protein [Chlamydiales bacterium]
MIRKILFFLLIPTLMHAGRIESLLAIGDAHGALLELEPMLAADPDNRLLQRQEIQCLAKQGNITALLKAYKCFNNSSDKALLEDVAWAIINQASHSNSNFIRQEAYIAAFMSNDARGIPLCQKALTDQSEQMRLLATSMAARAHDEVLKTTCHKALEHDPSKRVRLQSINTVGAMRYEPAQATLLKILESKDSDAVEKMAAIEALTHIAQQVDTSHIESLVKSDRAILRLLACELVLNQFDSQHAKHILPLINDSVFDVRLAAIECISALGQKPTDDQMELLLAHKDIKTKILANYLSLVVSYKEKEAVANFTTFMQHQDQMIRLFATGAICHSGRHIHQFVDSFAKFDDPLVRLNLAIGCIWQRIDVQRAASFILHALKDSGRLSWQNVGTISFVAPSTAFHSSQYARLPESEDLALRLELYSMLACCPNVSIYEPLKAFLKERTWGISGQSINLMMQEGLIYFKELSELVHDDCPEIALQAAFILAFYAQDDDALKVLTKAFGDSPRQMKEYILYAVATIGTKSALPFLVQVLNEPSESLRVMAARGILICLYK